MLHINSNPAQTGLAMSALAGGPRSMFDASSGQIRAHGARPFIGKDGHSYVLHVNGDQVRKIRVNATALLRYDEWKDIDRTVINEATARMRAVADLKAAGLTHGLGSIGLTVSLWDTMSDMTPAEISMSAATQGEKDTPAFSPRFVPVPIVHKPFQVELRRLEASRRFGEAIDMASASLAGRLVGEKCEQMLLNGASTIQLTDAALGAGVIYGYTTHPDRNQFDLDTQWDQVTDNQAIVDDVLAMIDALRNDRYFGPYVLYIPTSYERKMDEDYRNVSASSDTRTVRQRLMAIESLQDIRVTDFMTADNVVLVQMSKDVVDWAEAQDTTTVQWSTTGGMVEEFKVMNVGVPRVKSTFDGRSGICHGYVFAS